MKKILLILVLTLAAALPSQARKANINRSGDTTTIVMNGDTVRVTDGEVKKSISKAINDTLWSEKAETADDDETYNYMALDNDARLKEVSMWSSTVKQISISMCFCIMVVVFLSLLFYLLHRRAKYRVIEKAIENNYPLPPSLGGTPTYKQAPQRPDAWRNYAPQQQPQPQPQQPQPQAQPQAQPQPQQPPYQQGMNAPMQPNMPYRVNYMAYKKSFVLVTVGLMAAMFFESAGASPMVCLSMIVVLLGLGKGFVIYKEQKQDQDYWRWQMQQQQPQPPYAPQQPQPQPQAPQQPQAEQKPATEQPPVFTPPTDNK